jgi:hypothetical protein
VHILQYIDKRVIKKAENLKNLFHLYEEMVNKLERRLCSRIDDKKLTGRRGIIFDYG